MKTVAIIVEYNPFHNGHLYQINKVREETNADCIIVIMSGNYVQRGTPAIIDKYTRTKLALLNGVDLVFELPVYYATASAELFAYGAVNILNSLGIVDFLCFGSECGDIHLLEQLATILLEEPHAFQCSLKAYLKEGISFPNARKQALMDYMGYSESLSNILNEPNNILGIEYIKALKKLNSTIRPITLLRHGSGYHDKTMNHPFCSATALRNYYEALAENNDYLKEYEESLSTKIDRKQLSIDTFVPSTTKELLEDSYKKTFPITVDDFSSLLYYQLMHETSDSLLEYLDMNEDLANRIINEINYHCNFSSFIDHVKTKQFTYTRISRTLLHILLQIKKNDMNQFLNTSDGSYARLLGFKTSASKFIKDIKTKGLIPVITKVADAHQILNPIAMQCFQKDIHATHLYNQIVFSKYHTVLPNEFVAGPVIIKVNTNSCID